MGVHPSREAKGHLQGISAHGAGAPACKASTAAGPQIHHGPPSGGLLGLQSSSTVLLCSVDRGAVGNKTGSRWWHILTPDSLFARLSDMGGATTGFARWWRRAARYEGLRRPSCYRPSPGATVPRAVRFLSKRIKCFPDILIEHSPL